MIMASWISTIDHPKIPMQEIIHPSSFSPFASSPPTFSSWRRLNGSLPEYCWEGYWMGRGLFPHGFATEEKGTPLTNKQETLETEFLRRILCSE